MLVSVADKSLWIEQKSHPRIIVVYGGQNPDDGSLHRIPHAAKAQNRIHWGDENPWLHSLYSKSTILNQHLLMLTRHSDSSFIQPFLIPFWETLRR